MQIDRIMFIHPNLKMGGAERMITHTANLLASYYKVYMVLFEKTDDFFVLDERITVIRLNIEINRSLRKANVIKSAKHINDMINRLQAITKQIEPTMSIVFDDRVTWISWLGLKDTTIQRVYSQRNDPFQNSKIKNLIFRRVYREARGVVFQLESVRKYYNLWGSNYPIIPNANTKSIRPYCKTSGKIIISAGRFQYRKRFDLLIDAFSEVQKKYPDYRLIIYGDGEERKKLEMIIEEKALSEKVVLPGIVKDFTEESKNAMMFVLSSDAEGIPNTLIEAMSAGIPCIATDCSPGGASFLLDGGNNGLLVQQGNKEELTQAIVMYIENEQLREQKAKAGTEFLSQLKPEIIDLKWIGFIKTCMEI